MQIICMSSFVFVLIVLAGSQSALADESMHAAENSLVMSIRESVRDNWDEISDKCDEVLTLTKELPSLPDSAWFSRDKVKQRKRIHELQDRIRDLLLSERGRSLVKKCDEREARIVEQAEKVQKLVEKRQFSHDTSYDAKVEESRRVLATLQSEHEADMVKVRADLAEIGLKLDSKSGNVLFKLIDRADVIDNAILANGVAVIVENLRKTLPDGGMISARRYFGVYLALADLQIACFEQYLAKSRDGVWRTRIAEIEANAMEAIAKAKQAMSDHAYNAEQRELFRRNVVTNNKMIFCVEAYRKLLDCHESAVTKKLAEVRRIRDLAENSFSTVSNAAGMATLLEATNRDYSVILELEMPEIEGVDDAAVQAQIEAITRQLDTAAGN